jgi:putative phosphotransacetylase
MNDKINFNEAKNTEKETEEIIEKNNAYYVPVGVSNRHAHLNERDLEILFGKGHSLTPMKDLSQPGQFACEEKVTLVGKKGKIEGIRVLGPVRKQTQVEISLTDSYVVGIKPRVKMSGDLQDSSGGVLVGPQGEIQLENGVIISARHIHMSPEQADAWGLKDGDRVKIKKDGERAIVFEEVVVRSGAGHHLDFHIDTDEANAGGIKNGEMLLLEKYNDK